MMCGFGNKLGLVMTTAITQYIHNSRRKINRGKQSKRAHRTMTATHPARQADLAA